MRSRAGNQRKPSSKKSQSSSKKQRAQQPRSLVDNASLACVASPFGPIDTPVASTVTKEILLDRLNKEIVQKFHFSLSVPKSPGKKGKQYVISGGKLVAEKEPSAKRRKVDSTNSDDDDTQVEAKDLTRRWKVLNQRLVVGTNQCTRVLESAVANGDAARPSLVVLARDVHPPTILAHIPFLAKQIDAPILLLPGKSSQELGQILGTKRVAIFLFLPSNSRIENNEKTPQEIRSYHHEIDSFVEFAKSKLHS